jgi:hypothetical protein
VRCMRGARGIGSRAGVPVDGQLSLVVEDGGHDVQVVTDRSKVKLLADRRDERHVLLLLERGLGSEELGGEE